MFHRENRQAAQQIVESLRKALNDSTADLNDLRTALDKSAIGTAEDAIAVAKKTTVEVEQLRKQVWPLWSLMRQTPRTHELMTAAFKELETIGQVFDRYEEFARDKYGIEPICTTLQEKLADDQSEVPSSNVDEVGFVSKVPRKQQRGGSPSYLKTHTPSSKKMWKGSDIPATPRLEDFGLRDEEIRALATSAPGSHNKENERFAGVASTYSTSIGRNTGIEMDEDEYETMVLNSMSALGIESPAELEQRFATKRNVALKEVLQTTTPKVKAGSSERTLDYTNLANGYFESSRKDEAGRLHRTLNFGETPVTKRGGAVDIARCYEELEPFWKRAFEVHVIEAVVAALGERGEAEFSKEEFLAVLAEHVEAQRCETLAVVLAKMKVLSVHKVHGNRAVYRFDGKGGESSAAVTGI